MNSKILGLLVLATLSIGMALPARATTVVYGATLSGAAESPPIVSAGTGFTLVTIDDIANTMRVQVTFSGLTGTSTVAHIHCCTAVALAGTAGVATQTPTFSGFPVGVSSGNYDRTFDMTLAASYNAAFITANGGTTSTAFSALQSGLNAGKAYLNVHSAFAPGGEIRGFPSRVPEPGTLALLGLGLAGLGLSRRRKA